MRSYVRAPPIDLDERVSKSVWMHGMDYELNLNSLGFLMTVFIVVVTPTRPPAFPGRMTRDRSFILAGH